MVLDWTIATKSSAMKIFFQMEEILDFIELNPHKEGKFFQFSQVSSLLSLGAYNSLTFVAKDLENIDMSNHDFQQIIIGWQFRFAPSFKQLLLLATFIYVRLPSLNEKKPP